MRRWNIRLHHYLRRTGIDIEFTDKPVTPWGGLVLFSGLARQVGLGQALRDALPFRLTSPNATDSVEIVLAFMAGVLTGSRHLAPVEPCLVTTANDKCCGCP
jgi:hypothetical protein